MSELVKKNPFLPAFFDDFFTKDFFDWNDKNFTRLGSTLPSVNLIENEKNFRIELAAPGMKKDDFKIELHNGILTIAAEKKEEKEEKDKEGNYLRREFRYSSFKRSFNMPESIRQDDIKAKYNDGILTIDLAKVEEKMEKNKKMIEIR